MKYYIICMLKTEDYPLEFSYRCTSYRSRTYGSNEVFEFLDSDHSWIATIPLDNILYIRRVEEQ